MNVELETNVRKLLTSVPGLWLAQRAQISFQSDIDFVVFPCCVRRFKRALDNAVRQSPDFDLLLLWTYSRTSASVFLLDRTYGKVVHLDFYLPNSDYAPYGLDAVRICPGCSTGTMSMPTGNHISTLPPQLLEDFLRAKAIYKEAFYSGPRCLALVRRVRRVRIDWGFRLALKAFLAPRRLIFRNTPERFSHEYEDCMRRSIFAHKSATSLALKSVVEIFSLWIIRRRPLVVESKRFGPSLTDSEIFQWLAANAEQDLKRWAQE